MRVTQAGCRASRAFPAPFLPARPLRLPQGRAERRRRQGGAPGAGLAESGGLRLGRRGTGARLEWVVMQELELGNG